MSRVRSCATAAIAIAGAFLAMPGPAAAHDYPTKDLVDYVFDCAMRHPDRERQEMFYKCSCSMDFIAGKLDYDAYVEQSTASKAVSIAGERGNMIRDASDSMALAKKYRALEKESHEACFITD